MEFIQTYLSQSDVLPSCIGQCLFDISSLPLEGDEKGRKLERLFFLVCQYRFLVGGGRTCGTKLEFKNGRSNDASFLEFTEPIKVVKEFDGIFPLFTTNGDYWSSSANYL